MSRSATALMLEGNEPALRFEENHSVSLPASYQTTGHAHPESDPFSSLKRKQEELLKLRQQLEKTEHETTVLEAQRRKEERFDTGRREMMEKLSRSLGRLERDLYNCQKAIEEITMARDLYQRHQDIMQALQPEAWQRGNLDAELDRAIGAIEDAEDEFGKVSRRLASVLPGEQAALEHRTGGGGVIASLPQGFVSWMLCGLAFTLPLMAVLMVYCIVSHFIH